MFEEVPVGDAFKFTIERGQIESGKTFSQEAFETLLGNVNLFIASQVSNRWEQTNEPPTMLTVTVRCDIG